MSNKNNLQRFGDKKAQKLSVEPDDLSTGAAENTTFFLTSFLNFYDA